MEILGAFTSRISDVNFKLDLWLRELRIEEVDGFVNTSFLFVMLFFNSDDKIIYGFGDFYASFNSLIDDYYNNFYSVEF